MLRLSQALEISYNLTHKRYRVFHVGFTNNYDAFYFLVLFFLSLPKQPANTQANHSVFTEVTNFFAHSTGSVNTTNSFQKSRRKLLKKALNIDLQKQR